jgi:hypothetical protein
MINCKFWQAFGFIIILLVSVAPFNGMAQVPDQLEKEFVRGGQFKDLILPIPVYEGLESEGIWGAESVLPRDIHNGIEDNEWCYWGGNPIKGEDGKYHIAICRWKEETGHMGWFESEVAHCVSENPTGPYSVTKTIIEEGHNPEVIRLQDGTYILHTSGGNIYYSEKITGPWDLKGKIEIDERGHKGLSHLFTNLTGVERKDGSILFFSKRGDVMISNSGLLGPYKIVTAHNYSRYSGYPEDPVIWKSRHQYHVIYNHAVDRKSVYMRSLDGIHWITEPGQPYDSTIFRYADGTKNVWYKFERPKVLQDEYGRATHLSLAVIDVKKREDFGNDKHSSKHVVMPLVKEKLIEVINADSVAPDTREIKLRIKAEEGFDPKKQVDVQSLRLGSANVVNYGYGSESISSKSDGKDLVVTFGGDGLGIFDNDFDFKLLGKTKSNELITGYALRPGRTEAPASLVTLPILFKKDNDIKVLHSSVENYGLKDSEPCKLKVFELTEESRTLLNEFEIPAMKPYQEFKIEVPLQYTDTEIRQYEAVIIGSKEKITYWKTFDDSHYSIVYSGDWIENRETGKNIYMGSERISSRRDSSAAFFFSGSQARCYGSISKDMGSVDVYIDGIFIERVDCYFSAEIHNSVIYQTEILPDGLHKLELRVTGEHHKDQELVKVAIDAFSYK